MQRPDLPNIKDLVLVGGGHTHALVLRAWGMKPVAGVRLTLIDPNPTAPYSGMLPGHIAGHYDRAALEIDLVRLARFAGARLILGAVDRIDAEARRLHVPGRPPIAYDLVSLDVGVTARMAAVPGFAAHAVPAKPLDGFARAWAAYCDRDGPAKIAIIGGGVAGVELALAAAHRMRTLGRKAEVTVIDRGTILASTAQPVRRRLSAAMDRYGIATRPDAQVTEMRADGVQLAHGPGVAADFVIGAAGAVPHPWVAETGMATERGYLSVDEHLRSLSHPDVYGAGDCVHLSHAPRPKAGVYAVRAAPVLLNNLRAALTGSARRAFHPQKDFLKLISLGEKSALAEKSGIAVAGPAMWRWKNRIDRSFMDRLRILPKADAPALPRPAAKGLATAVKGPPPCGGCGAKLGAAALAPLAGLWNAAGTSDAAAGILVGIGDDAAVVRVGGARQAVSTDHIRAFAGDLALVTQAAALHAMGDLWAMGATPETALAQVILPRLSPDLQARTLAEVMQSATDICAAEGVEIVGGHSSMGTEAVIGFTVMGEMTRDPIGLGGARAGDALILTRPVGIGTVLAAEMRGRADGAAVAEVWALMTRSQSDAARVLAPVAHAMTDVTGFGLAGHLAALATASGLGAELDLDAVPLLGAARALADRGIRSSLFAENRAGLADRISPPDDARAPLLFDPQTCGGLLAALPQGQAQTALRDLRALGHDAAIVGRMVGDTTAITVTTR